MASVYRKPIKITDPKTGRKVKSHAKKWWGRFTDELGREKRVPLATDKTAAQTMLNEQVRKVERIKAGLVDPSEDQRKRPLGEHIAEFKKFLMNRAITRKQVTESTKRIDKIVSDQKFSRIADITANAVVEFLSELRKSGKSAQTHNNYLVSIKQFTHWLLRERRINHDPLAHISRQNVQLDRRHDRRALSSDEFNRLVAAARAGKKIENISGPDRGMLYVLAAWTGFRKGELGSLTRRSFCLDAVPATATVAACYSKRRREDTQVLHPAVVRLLADWLATKENVKSDGLLFPVSGKVPGGIERKTNKMMKRDLLAARATWIEEAQEDPVEMVRREQTDFLTYENDDGLFADFHSNRHMFITSLEQAGLSPKMAQTLARHSDVRLTLGIYTHVGLHDQTAAICSLPAPPSANEGDSEPSELRATGTDGPTNESEHQHGEVPKRGNVGTKKVPSVVPRGAEIGAIRLASETRQIAPNCTARPHNAADQTDAAVVVNPNGNRAFRTECGQSASRRTATRPPREQVHPRGLEPLTFGSVDRCSIQLS